MGRWWVTLCGRRDGLEKLRPPAKTKSFAVDALHALHPPHLRATSPAVTLLSGYRSASMGLP